MYRYKINYSQFGGIVPNDIAKGTIVVIQSLKKREDLNNAIGQVIVYNEEKKRIGIELLNTVNKGQKILLRPKNLITEEEMKIAMVKDITTKHLELRLSLSITPKYKNALQKYESLEARSSSYGVGIFSKNEYEPGELIFIDLPLKSESTRFFSQDYYGESHNLSNLSLFPVCGLINHLNNPNCILLFVILKSGENVGFLFAIKKINQEDELTIHYSPGFTFLHYHFQINTDKSDGNLKSIPFSMETSLRESMYKSFINTDSIILLSSLLNLNKSNLKLGEFTDIEKVDNQYLLYQSYDYLKLIFTEKLEQLDSQIKQNDRRHSVKTVVQLKNEYEQKLEQYKLVLKNDKSSNEERQEMLRDLDREEYKQIRDLKLIETLLFNPIFNEIKQIFQSIQKYLPKVFYYTYPYGVTPPTKGLTFINDIEKLIIHLGDASAVEQPDTAAATTRNPDSVATTASAAVTRVPDAAATTVGDDKKMK